MSSPEWNPTSQSHVRRFRDRQSRNGRWPAVEPNAEKLLEVKIELRGDTTVLSVSGDIDLMSESVLRSALTSQLTAGPDVLVVDLSGVSFLSSVGLAALMAAREQAWIAGVTLRLVCCGHPVLRPMAITGLIGLFEIYPDLATALLG